MTTDRRRIAIWLAVFLALALATWARIWVIDHLRDQGYFAKYLTFADQILAGNVPVQRIGDVSPAYLWLMVALRAIGLGVNAIRDLQLVMLTVAALFCALAAKRLGGWVAAIVAAALVLGNRAGLIVGAELEPEALVFILNAAAILATLRRNWLAAGLLIGLSTTARPVAMLTIILVAGWAFLESRRAALKVIAAAALPVAIVLIVNSTLVGHVFIMQPGSQLYDGNNPLSTGCAGVMPRIVNDLEATTREPDYLHVAYRIIAARATGTPIDPKASNRYWSAKAFSFMTLYPVAFMDLIGWKAILTVHHYDVYDLLTTKRKSMELARYPAIPFGVAFVLSLLAFILRRDRRELIPIALFSLATFAALVAFNVSSRQRNALLAPLAVLGGIGAAEMVRLARARSERALFAFAGLMIVTPILGIEGTPMREDAYNWASHMRAMEARAKAHAALRQSDMRAVDLASIASVIDPVEPPMVSKRLLGRAALAMAGQIEEPPRLFDVAIALQRANLWRESEAVLASIEDYRPRRENRVPSSVAYYRARAAIHLRAPKRVVDAFLDLAESEAAGDPNVLALRSLTVERDAIKRLDRLHDPFTRDFALAQAFEDLGYTDRAAQLRRSLALRFPEWKRPSIPPIPDR